MGTHKLFPNVNLNDILSHPHNLVSPTRPSHQPPYASDYSRNNMQPTCQPYASDYSGRTISHPPINYRIMSTYILRAKNEPCFTKSTYIYSTRLSGTQHVKKKWISSIFMNLCSIWIAHMVYQCLISEVLMKKTVSAPSHRTTVKTIQPFINE